MRLMGSLIIVDRPTRWIEGGKLTIEGDHVVKAVVLEQNKGFFDGRRIGREKLMLGLENDFAFLSSP